MPVVQSIFLMFGYLIAFVVGEMLLQEEFTEVIQWWITLAALGFSCLPLTNLLFSGFHDGGFLFSCCEKSAASSCLSVATSMFSIASLAYSLLSFVEFTDQKDSIA